MLIFLILFFILFLIFMFLLVINFILSKKMFKNREKMSSFECGFDSMSLNRLPFSLQFFVIAIIFLIFDIEIALIFPMIFMNKMNYYYLIFNLMLILMILLMGLYIEWLEGSLKWFKSFKKFI